MPSRTDHDRRDAQHAARATIAIKIGQYVRRIQEESYADIERVAAEYDGTEPIDWSQVGALAASRALASYGVTGAQAAIDIEDVAAIEAGDAADLEPANS